MARSAWFGQRLADLTGLRVARATYQETTALGAALFAGLGAGVFESVEAAAASRPEAEDLTPQLGVHARESAYARWLDAVSRTRNIGSYLLETGDILDHRSHPRPFPYPIYDYTPQ